MNDIGSAIREVRVINVVRNFQEDDAYHHLQELSHLRAELLILTETEKRLKSVSDRL